MTNSGGAVVEKYRYSPYGESGSEGDGGFPFRFTGQKLDPETGLYYYKARYYDPETGHSATAFAPQMVRLILQTDPIGYEDQMNLYAYVGNDPVNATDPSGKAAFVLPFIPPAVGAAVKGITFVGSALIAAVVANEVINEVKDGDESGTLPDSIYDRKAPGQRSPAGGETIDHGRYNPATGEYEQSEVEYDEYGRQKKRTDHSDHGYPEEHDNPHVHEYEYGPGYAPGGRETRDDKRDRNDDDREEEQENEEVDG